MATKKRAPARRGPAARSRTRRPARQRTRNGGVLAALVALFRSLFNRSTPASGGGGGDGSTSRSAPARRRWEDDRERDEYGRWEQQDDDRLVTDDAESQDRTGGRSASRRGDERPGTG